MDAAKTFGRMTLGFAVLCLAACAGARGSRQALPAQTIYYNARFITMDPQQPTAEAVAVAGGNIMAVGPRSQVFERRGLDTKMVDLQGATVFPGFIDTHSHLMGYAIYNDPEHWLDVSNENFLFKPAPGDPRCADPRNPQVCFIPVTNEDEVLARLAAAVEKDPGGTAPVLAFGHDVARLGSSAGCAGFGFACPNLQDGHARETLDAISKSRPIFVSSSSGHFGYANTPALQQLNICGTR
jgi:predicted amidohydrolase YtcJ